MPLSPYQQNVFINCPFDEDFRALLEAIVFAVHDISRTELDPDTLLPRFNMPLELGIFLGAKRFGSVKQKRKNGLILDRERYRYQSFCSDIAGQDVRAHGADPDEAIKIVRNWLRAATTKSGIRMPGPVTIQRRYRAFRGDLPLMCQELQLDEHDLIFNDYTTLISSWLQTNQW